jgi:NTP pyrophosphatase (non-canonical NTP hydrolase)
MKNLIEENYKSIVARGLITSGTKLNDFIDKLLEETMEFHDASNNFLKRPTKSNNLKMDEELADVILVCLNIAKHYKIDIEKELNNKIKKNFKRSLK